MKHREVKANKKKKREKTKKLNEILGIHVMNENEMKVKEWNEIKWYQNGIRWNLQISFPFLSNDMPNQRMKLN